MSELKESCQNCAGLIDAHSPSQHVTRCDYSGNDIKNPAESTCEDWEPNDDMVNRQREKLFIALKNKNAYLKRQVAELQAQCAAMRRIIEEVKRTLSEDHKKGLINDTAYEYIVVKFIDKALSTPLGADLLQRVRELEQAARDAEELLRYQCDVLPIANIIAALVGGADNG